MITLHLTPVQYDIVRTAVMEYTDNLMQIIDPLEVVTLPEVKSAAPRADAPWGLKKDGTPRARPGRKSAKKARKAQA